MSQELKVKSRRILEEAFPRCDVDLLRDLISEHSYDHMSQPGQPQGVEGTIRAARWLASVFSEQRWEVHRLIGEGNLVAAHATHYGRHTGDFMGVAPTGRTVAHEEIHIARFVDGQVVEHWGMRDDLTLLRQLGVLPERGLLEPRPVSTTPAS